VQDLPGSVRVDVGVGAVAQNLLPVKDFEQVELEIPHIALVVAHPDVLRAQIEAFRPASPALTSE